MDEKNNLAGFVFRAKVELLFQIILVGEVVGGLNPDLQHAKHVLPLIELSNTPFILLFWGHTR